MFKIFFLFLILSFSPVNAQDLFYPYGSTASSDPDIKTLEWNRYTNGKFTVLSIDNKQGKWVADNAEKIHQFCLRRWGFPEAKLSRECRIFCVPNNFLLKKLFSIDNSKAEIRKDVNVIWIVASDPMINFPEQMTQVALNEFELQYKVKLGFWFKRGSSLLNNSIPQIRENLLDFSYSVNPSKIEKEKSLFLSQKMFLMNEEDYQKQSPENKKIFDDQAMILCLMLRKEFGEAKLQGFLNIATKNNSQEVMKAIYGFRNFEHFDQQYLAFIRDLAPDIINKKTPDSYLEIYPVR